MRDSQRLVRASQCSRGRRRRSSDSDWRLADLPLSKNRTGGARRSRGGDAGFARTSNNGRRTSANARRAPLGRPHHGCRVRGAPRCGTSRGLRRGLRSPRARGPTVSRSCELASGCEIRRASSDEGCHRSCGIRRRRESGLVGRTNPRRSGRLSAALRDPCGCCRLGGVAADARLRLVLRAARVGRLFGKTARLA